MGCFMLINGKCKSRVSQKRLSFFLLLVFSGVFESCSLNATYVPPEGTWDYPGGAGPPMSMVFNSGGSLTFVGGFDNYHPATWHFDEQTHTLRIKVSNYDKLPTECETSSTHEYSCLLYNPKTDSFECKFTSKTKIITFLGWNFFRE